MHAFGHLKLKIGICLELGIWLLGFGQLGRDEFKNIILILLSPPTGAVFYRGLSTVKSRYHSGWFDLRRAFR